MNNNINVFEVPIQERLTPVNRVTRLVKGPLFYGALFIILITLIEGPNIILFLIALFPVLPNTIIPLLIAKLPFKVEINKADNELILHYLKHSFINRSTKIPFNKLYFHFDYTGHRPVNYSLKYKGLEIWKGMKMIVVIFEDPELGWYPEEVNEVYEELKKIASMTNDKAGSKDS